MTLLLLLLSPFEDAVLPLVFLSLSNIARMESRACSPRYSCATEDIELTCFKSMPRTLFSSSLPASCPFSTTPRSPSAGVGRGEATYTYVIAMTLDSWEHLVLKT
ncbi:hypothetical protein K402DRAFT_396473 [Aulographum hederae CBS 113979]|uniref:Secreted protein n=1 Tax=Aulographum hederae CBS 113979 TaxID=1176131 RepID=A0A6G1GRW6_9PEZI|nr:hypothetical protein K402DRAFT_396473 [Aulographum hederae CBS 113979]